MTSDSFATRDRLAVDDTTYGIHRLDRIDGADRLPYSLKVLLENLLRSEDGRLVTAEQVSALAAWQPAVEHGGEVAFTPARVLMHDFTGVPCVVDLVAMRDAITALGGGTGRINPLIPTELVIDHSLIADVFARPDAFRVNAELEFERNKERYQMLRWAQQAFADFSVVPPDTGICHQVNLEYLSRVVFTREGPDGPLAYPDTLVGTDSHTPMVNGLGVLGWGRHRGRGDDRDYQVPPRSYSLANAPAPDERVSLLVTRVPGSATSTWMHDRLRNADPVMLTGPYGTFVPDPDLSGAVPLLAAGSGLAPARALAEALLDEQPTRPVTLFFSSRTIADAIDHARFQDWAANRQGFRYLLTLTRAPDAPRRPHIPDLLADAVGELIGWEVFVSGPPVFVTGCAAAGRALGADPAAVHTEEFFADPQPWTGPPPVAVEPGVCP